MLDVNDVTLIGTCKRAFKYVGSTFDSLTMFVSIGDNSFKVKASGKKDKFFGEKEYEGQPVMILGRLKYDEYKKKTGEAVKEYVIDASPSKVNLLVETPSRGMATARVGGKITAIKEDFLVLACRYMGGFGDKKEFKDRKVLVSIKALKESGANIPDMKVGHTFVVAGNLQEHKTAGTVLSARAIFSAFSKSLK